MNWIISRLEGGGVWERAGGRTSARGLSPSTDTDARCVVHRRLFRSSRHQQWYGGIPSYQNIIQPHLRAVKRSV